MTAAPRGDADSHTSLRALALLALMRWLPAWSVEPAARVLATIYRGPARRKLRRATRYLELAFGDRFTDRERLRMARGSLFHQAVSLIETARELERPGSVTIEGVEAFGRQVADLEQVGRGQILVTAHLGSWELLNRAATEAAAYGFHALAKRPDQAVADSLLERLRAAAGTRVLPSGAKSTLRRMLEILRQGGWIGLAMDQKPEGPGIAVPFFGRSTPFVAGPANLIDRQGCRVLVAFCVRTGPSRYRLTARPLELSAGIDREEITHRLAAALEAAIRDHPEQWLWTYRRW